MMDPKLISLLGDKRFRCFVQVLKGKECDMLNIDPERLLSGDQAEIDKVYKFLPELDAVRRQGYDIVGRLVELSNRLRSENVRDLSVAFALMFSVMFGREVSEEDAARIGEVVDVFRCIRVGEDGVEVDGQCLDSLNVPEEFKNQVRMVTLANLVWSA